MFLLNVSYSKAPDEVTPHVKPHGEWVTRYFKEGIFLFAGPKKSGLGGVIGAKAIEKRRLLEILAEDPYVKADVADVEIVDFDCKAATDAIAALKGI